MPIGFNIAAFPQGHWPDGHWPIHHWPGFPFTRSDSLLHSPCFIIGSHIISEGKMSLPSLSTDWPIYKSYLPDGDNVEDNAGSIYDYFSEEHSCLRTTGNGRHYGLQVMVRSLDYEAGHYKSQEILDALDGLQNEPIEFGDYNYEIQVVVPISGVNCIGREPNTKSRYLFTLNFTSVIKYLEAA